MTRSELRIGNYVYAKEWVIKPYGIDGFVNIIKNIDNYKPILLTEEWLGKFGFETNDWTDKGKTVYVGYVKEELMLQGTIKNLTLDGGGFDIKIKHVHQLQNLYFALTGKELEI